MPTLKELEQITRQVCAYDIDALDQMVTLRIFGYRPKIDGKFWPAVIEFWYDKKGNLVQTPKFSTDIGEAWRVVEWFVKRFPDFSLNHVCVPEELSSPDDIWEVYWGFDGYGWHAITGPTVPIALCRAALYLWFIDKAEEKDD